MIFCLQNSCFRKQNKTKQNTPDNFGNCRTFDTKRICHFSHPTFIFKVIWCCGHLFLPWNWISKSGFVFLNVRFQLSAKFLNTFLRHAEVFFPFLRDFLTGAKITPAWACLSRTNPKSFGRFWKILRWLMRWSCELFRPFFAVFSFLKS